jgi:photosystem II stability/assembly factor-like uncharacterized protein
MRTTTSLKREVLVGMALAVSVILCAWAWGKPFLVSPAPAGQSQTQSRTQSTSFAGTIERAGEQFFLRAESGRIYQLDDARDAQRFVAQPVAVTGWLEAGSQLIHVQRIEPARS